MRWHMVVWVNHDFQISDLGDKVPNAIGFSVLPDAISTIEKNEQGFSRVINGRPVFKEVPKSQVWMHGVLSWG